MTVTIKCLTPKGYEVTIPFYDYDPDGNIAAWFEDLASFDSALASRGFKPLPVPKSGGGNWNKDGKPTAKNWVDVDPANPVLYVCLAWHGKNKEENDAYKIEWANKLEAATGVRYTLDTSKQDETGKKLYLWVYPLKVGTKLLEALPEAEFERRPTLQARLDAKKDK